MFFSLAQAFRRAGHEVNIYTSQFDPKYFPHLHGRLELTPKSSFVAPRSELRAKSSKPDEGVLKQSTSRMDESFAAEDMGVRAEYGTSESALNIQIVPPQKSLDSVRGATGVLGKIRERVERDRLFADAARRIGRAMGDNFDVVIAQNDPSYQLGVAYKRMDPKARFVWIMNNPPFYRTAKGDLFTDIGSRAAAFIAKRKIYRYITGIDLIVVHDSERKKLVEEFPVSSLNLPIPVDFESFNAPVKTRVKGNKEARILSVGSLSPARKFEDIILAASHLRKWGYDARVTLICKDFWRDTAYREALLKIAKDSGMEGHVHCMFEGASEDELRKIQRESDVFVFPPTFRIANMSSFEAMAAGLPLVVSDATSVAEKVEDNTTAMVAKAGNPEDIARKIKTLIDNPAIYNKVAVAGQEYVRENLNWDAYARKFLEATFQKKIQ